MTDGSTQLLAVDEPREQPKERTLKQTFGKIRDFSELTQRFTFYNPITYHLVADITRTNRATDIISHVLANILGEHPLVITDLSRAVFTFDSSMLLMPEWKSFRRKLYAVPTEVWNQAREQQDVITLFDPASHRLCALTPQTFRIPNPMMPLTQQSASHAEYELSVELFTCYGNREIYCFHARTVTEKLRLPKLMFHPPVREFSGMADHLLTALRRQTTPAESVICESVEMLRDDRQLAQLVAMQRDNKLHQKLATPLSESQLNAAQLAECRKLIRHYEEIFGQAGSIA